MSFARIRKIAFPTIAQGALPIVLLVFVASAFVLPKGPDYALVFYLAVAPAVLLGAWARNPAARTGAEPASWSAAMLLIFWSMATLIWGRDDGHRTGQFALAAVMTALFVAGLLTAAGDAGLRRRLATTLIWAGTANAVLSVGLGPFLPQNGERLHGWGATSHPILGASVMTAPYLAALVRALSERRWRAAHFGAAGAMMLFILLTESRGPLFASTVGTLVVCAGGPWRTRALGGLAAFALAWRLLPAGLRHHQTALLVARGASHRFEIWHRTLQMVAAHPLFGNGLAANLDLPGMTFPHDLYLSVLFYSGAVGAALFLVLTVLVTRQLWRGRNGGPEWLWLLALWVSTILAGLTDLGQITKGPGPMWFIFWLPVGLILARQSNPKEKKASF